MSIDPTKLPEDPATLQHLLLEAQAEIARLQMLIAGLLRHRFGRRSEQLSNDALDQGLEDLEQSLAEQTAKIEATAQPAARPMLPKLLAYFPMISAAQATAAMPDAADSPTLL